jgi:DNA-binding transcriptional LysR family regulator
MRVVQHANIHANFSADAHPIPQTPQDLMSHNCINQRMLTSGGLYVWDFEHRGRQVNVRVDGSLIFNTVPPQVDAALAGLGIGIEKPNSNIHNVNANRK